MELLKRSKSSFWSKIPISLIILVLIFFDLLAGNLRLCSQNQSIFFLLQFFCPSIPDAPAFSPFLDYPVYGEDGSQGVNVNQYFLYGTLEDGTEVVISHEDLNIPRYQFVRNLVPKVERQNIQVIEEYVKIYERKFRTNLVRLRLENHPLIIHRDGMKTGQKEVVVDLNI